MYLQIHYIYHYTFRNLNLIFLIIYILVTIKMYYIQTV